MREIKFRAWDLDNFNMLHSDKEEESGEGLIIWEIDNNGSPQFLEPQIIDTCPGGEYHEQTIEYRAPKQKIMQCTGLKDKNGKEIYEGDITEIEFGKKAEIKYIKNAGGFFLEIHHKVSKEQIQLTKSWAEEIEIIGNKYEDGDLIECS